MSATLDEKLDRVWFELLKSKQLTKRLEEELRELTPPTRWRRMLQALSKALTPKPRPRPPPPTPHTLKWNEIRRTFRRDVQRTPEHIAMMEVIREAEAIRDMCMLPTPDYPEISRRADALHFKSFGIVWDLSYARSFITQTKIWARSTNPVENAYALESINSFLSATILSF